MKHESQGREILESSPTGYGEEANDQEMQAAAAEASQADWYARAEARGVTADHVRPGVELDTWAALNPGTGWAANEDRAAELARYPDQAAQYADADADVA